MPPHPGSGAGEAMMAQYAYLYQLSQLLNLSEAQLAAAETALKTVSAEKAGQKDLSRQAQNLKALILKSADTVERRMDELRTELSGSYVAQSDFGAYVEQLSLYLEANPEALTQYYCFAAEMQGELDRVDAAFQEYRTETGGYIRTGIVAYEEDGTPIYGVAVGQDLTVREVDGETVVEARRFRSTFTASRLSFWQDGTEVAYISDNRLHIREAEVQEALSVGKWRISTENGLAIRYLG